MSDLTTTELVKRLEYRAFRMETDPDGVVGDATWLAKQAAARIRLLEQQLSTAREEERERCVKAAEEWLHDFDTEVGLAAAIRSLGESGAHPPGE